MIDETVREKEKKELEREREREMSFVFRQKRRRDGICNVCQFSMCYMRGRMRVQLAHTLISFSFFHFIFVFP